MANIFFIIFQFYLVLPLDPESSIFGEGHIARKL